MGTLEEFSKERVGDIVYDFTRFLEPCFDIESMEKIVQDAIKEGAEWQAKQSKDAFFKFFRSRCIYAVTEFNCHMYKEDVACCVENCDRFKQFTLDEG
jgi:hypothetical protein|nr:MAG TPA: hypothetical protein [Caudoviricetes sp.]